MSDGETRRAPKFTCQIVVRVTPEMYADLELDAAEHGRTVAQSVRWHLRRSLEER